MTTAYISVQRPWPSQLLILTSNATVLRTASFSDCVLHAYFNLRKSATLLRFHNTNWSDSSLHGYTWMYECLLSIFFFNSAFSSGAAAVLLFVLWPLRLFSNARTSWILIITSACNLHSGFTCIFFFFSPFICAFLLTLDSAFPRWTSSWSRRRAYTRGCGHVAAVPGRNALSTFSTSPTQLLRIFTLRYPFFLLKTPGGNVFFSCRRFPVIVALRKPRNVRITCLQEFSVNMHLQLLLFPFAKLYFSVCTEKTVDGLTNLPSASTRTFPPLAVPGLRAVFFTDAVEPFPAFSFH